MKLSILVCSIILLLSSQAKAVNVSTIFCSVDLDTILVKMKGTSGDPFSQYGKIRLVRPSSESPILNTSEAKTVYRYGNEVIFNENDFTDNNGNFQYIDIQFGDKLVVWTETYNYQNFIECNWLFFKALYECFSFCSFFYFHYIFNNLFITFTHLCEKSFNLIQLWQIK